MEINLGKQEGKTKTLVIIIVLLIIVVAIVAYFLLSGSSIGNTVISADNYEEISDEIANEYGDGDEVYYYSYACSYYIMTNAMSSEYLTTEDDSLLYQDIYGKTVDELISEGKDLMEENGVTPESWKESLTSYTSE